MKPYALRKKDISSPKVFFFVVAVITFGCLLFFRLTLQTYSYNLNYQELYYFNSDLNSRLFSLNHLLPDNLISKEVEAAQKFLTIANYSIPTYKFHSQMIKTLEEFDHFFAVNNITYFVHAGTLIGTYMHHDVIPWDDDCDIIMSIDEKPKLVALLGYNKHPTMGLYHGIYMRWKSFLKQGSVEIFRHPWNWPYLDISFWYDNTTTSLYDYTNPKYIYQKTDVYPIIRRPFDRLRLPVPRHGYKYIEWAYKQCCVGFWDHRRETLFPHGQNYCVPCHHIANVFPFSQVLPYNKTHNLEIVNLAGKTIKQSFELIF